VRAGSAAVGGKGGGGRPDMAQAGGPDGAAAQAALTAIEEQLAALEGLFASLCCGFSPRPGPPPHPVRSTHASRAHDSMLPGWSGGEVGPIPKMV